MSEQSRRQPWSLLFFPRSLHLFWSPFWSPFLIFFWLSGFICGSISSPYCIKLFLQRLLFPGSESLPQLYSTDALSPSINKLHSDNSFLRSPARVGLTVYACKHVLLHHLHQYSEVHVHIIDEKAGENHFCHTILQVRGWRIFHTATCILFKKFPSFRFLKFPMATW